MNDVIKMKPCYDGGVCRNEDAVEDLAEALAIAVAALRQYAQGKTWRHIATDALRELEERGLVEDADMPATSEPENMRVNLTVDDMEWEAEMVFGYDG